MRVRSPHRLQTQLILTMGAIVLLVIAAVVLVALIAARQQMLDVGMQEAMVRAQAFAYRAGFATLVAREDPDSAYALLQEVTAAPQTLGAELVDASGACLATHEQQIRALAACRFTPQPAVPKPRVSLHSVAKLWCLQAPVRARSAGGAGHDTGTVIGYLRIVSSKAHIESVVRRLIVYIVAAGCVMLALGSWLLWRAAHAITRPLSDIVATMRARMVDGKQARAVLAGPEECVTISQVYNALMDDLERHSSGLEAKVQQRTRELRIATDAARQAERYKSAFMAAVSHEMKTPLHIIEANAHDVAGELEFIPGSERAREYMAIILKECAELTRRLSQVLVLARNEAGGYEVVRTEFDLAGFAADLRRKGVLLARKNLNVFEVQVQGERACTDRDMLLQITMNLVMNACKHTHFGRITVRITQKGELLELEVRDTGCGIPEAQQALVWREFHQAHPDEGNRFGGFGLGLSIVQRFATLLGGTVQLWSDEGRGTRVQVTVPAGRSGELNPSSEAIA